MNVATKVVRERRTVQTENMLTLGKSKGLGWGNWRTNKLIPARDETRSKDVQCYGEPIDSHEDQIDVSSLDGIALPAQRRQTKYNSSDEICNAAKAQEPAHSTDTCGPRTNQLLISTRRVLDLYMYEANGAHSLLETI